EEIFYSARYNDDKYEVKREPIMILPKQIARWLPKRILSEQEWRSFGIKQSVGWEHFMLHDPEPHILLFRREKDYQVKYSNATQTRGGLVG
ncbi:cyclin-dependent kinases regulatory subunit 1, partial [Gonapodya prolifera JEL478]